jgi:alkylhydroperoxidase family enzyme
VVQRAGERAALAFAEDVVRDDREVTEAGEARLAEHFTKPERLELTFVVGYQVFASKFAKAYRLPPQNFSAAGRR